MLIDTPETRLKKFASKHCKKKSIMDIPQPELVRWRKDTKVTGGKYLKTYMSPKIWSDSAKSLITASNVVQAMTPPDLMGEEVVSLVAKLQIAALKRHSQDYQAKHGTFEAQMARNAVKKSRSRGAS